MADQSASKAQRVEEVSELDDAKRKRDAAEKERDEAKKEWDEAYEQMKHFQNELYNTRNQGGDTTAIDRMLTEAKQRNQEAKERYQEAKERYQEAKEHYERVQGLQQAAGALLLSQLALAAREADGQPAADGVVQEQEDKQSRCTMSTRPSLSRWTSSGCVGR